MTARTRLQEQATQSLDENDLFGGASRAVLRTAGGRQSSQDVDDGALMAESQYSKDDGGKSAAVARGQQQQQHQQQQQQQQYQQQQQQGARDGTLSQQPQKGREVGFIAMLFKV